MLLQIRSLLQRPVARIDRFDDTTIPRRSIMRFATQKMSCRGVRSERDVMGNALGLAQEVVVVVGARLYWVTLVEKTEVEASQWMM